MLMHLNDFIHKNKILMQLDIITHLRKKNLLMRFNKIKAIIW